MFSVVGPWIWFSGIQPAVEVVLERAHEPLREGLRRDVAVLVRVLVHDEHVQVPAVDPHLVEQMGQLDIAVVRVGQDQEALPALFGRLVDAVEHVRDEEELDLVVRHHLDAEVGIGVFVDLLARDAAHPLQYLHVPERHPFGWAVFELLHASSSR